MVEEMMVMMGILIVVMRNFVVVMGVLWLVRCFSLIGKMRFLVLKNSLNIMSLMRRVVCLGMVCRLDMGNILLGWWW